MFSRVGFRRFCPDGATTIALIAASVCLGFMLWKSPPNASAESGEAGFKKYCAACHVDGGNIIKADKTLSSNDRKKNGIVTARDIVRIMRKPGQGMDTFDKTLISDKDAEAIAEYIIKTFK